MGSQNVRFNDSIHIYCFEWIYVFLLLLVGPDTVKEMQIKTGTFPMAYILLYGVYS